MTQRWNPTAYTRDAAFVFESSHDLVDWLDPKPGERILDLGCGTGEHVARIAARDARPVGLDASTEMIATAKATHPALEFIVGDGQTLRYEHAFDAVFSNAALHWMPNADAVAQGVARALVEGGRFVLEMPEARNVARVIDAFDTALCEIAGQRFDRKRWYFPTLGEHAARLEAAGFDVVLARVFPRPSFVPHQGSQSGLELWLELFANDILDALGAKRRDVIRRTEEHARVLERDGGFELDYVRLRMEARKSSQQARRVGAQSGMRTANAPKYARPSAFGRATSRKSKGDPDDTNKAPEKTNAGTNVESVT